MIKSANVQYVDIWQDITEKEIRETLYKLSCHQSNDSDLPKQKHPQERNKLKAQTLKRISLQVFCYI